jgi:hypothetical protein
LSCSKRILVIAAALIAVSIPSAAHAQRGRRIARPVIVTPYFSNYYGPFFWDFYDWAYPGIYPPAYYGRQFIGESTARIQVTPRDTEVYVDGYRAGIVDDFDGFAQRLRVAPGEHVIELYLDGHKPVTQTILFHPGETYRIRHAMEPLAAGEAAPARPTPRTPTAVQSPAPPYDALGRPIMRGGSPASSGIGGGVIAIRVQPGDAVVLVDGERWQSSSSDRLEIQVSPGPHRIEVQKDGYQPFTTNIHVRPGETATVNISLTRAGEVEDNQVPIGSSRSRGSKGSCSDEFGTRNPNRTMPLELWNSWNVWNLA